MEEDSLHLPSLAMASTAGAHWAYTPPSEVIWPNSPQRHNPDSLVSHGLGMMPVTPLARDLDMQVCSHKQTVLLHSQSCKILRYAM
jgi:hypothetical protein